VVPAVAVVAVEADAVRRRVAAETVQAAEGVQAVEAKLRPSSGRTSFERRSRIDGSRMPLHRALCKRTPSKSGTSHSCPALHWHGDLRALEGVEEAFHQRV